MKHACVRLVRCLLVISLGLAAPARADPPEDAPDPPPGTFDFAARFARSRAALGNTLEPSVLGNVDLSWRQRASQHLQAGVLGGYTAVTQTGRALTAGMRLEGYHGGVNLRGLAWPHPSLEMSVETSYVYFHVKDTLTDQSVALAWQETQIAAGGMWQAMEALRLFGRLHYGARDGQERAYGTVNHTADFNTHKTGGTAGLELRVDQSGDVGIQRSWGLHDGILVYFQRRWP